MARGEGTEESPGLPLQGILWGSIVGGAMWALIGAILYAVL